jgi:hypothetical protein
MHAAELGSTTLPSEPKGSGVTSTQHGLPAVGPAETAVDVVCAQVSAAAAAEPVVIRAGARPSTTATTVAWRALRKDMDVRNLAPELSVGRTFAGP